MECYRRKAARKLQQLPVLKSKLNNSAKQFSSNNGGGEVRIHRPNGRAKFRDSDTVKPGNDPKSVKDTKF